MEGRGRPHTQVGGPLAEPSTPLWSLSVQALGDRLMWPAFLGSRLRDTQVLEQWDGKFLGAGHRGWGGHCPR